MANPRPFEFQTLPVLLAIPAALLIGHLVFPAAIPWWPLATSLAFILLGIWTVFVIEATALRVGALAAKIIIDLMAKASVPHPDEPPGDVN